MADDWSAGDLALCVDTRERVINGRIACAGVHLRKGAIYTVHAILPQSSMGTPGPILHLRDGRRGGAWRFRKIKPLSDTEREEALRDLKAPVREPAA